MLDLDQLTKRASSTIDRFRLEGKAALVVGGSGGLGQAMALALASAGAEVCVVGRTDAKLKETAEAIGRVGKPGRFVVADVTREDEVERMVARVVEFSGRIDILVNSQGISYLQPSAEFDIEQWQKSMDVNLKSLVLCCKYVGRVMLRQGKGKIINLSSVRAFQGRAEDLAYAPSKGAVNQLTRSLAIEWGPKGIHVNAIAPAFTLTAMNAPILVDPAKKAWVLSRIPLQRLGERDDYFGPVVFLASDASDFVNGHVLMVDGGWLAA